MKNRKKDLAKMALTAFMLTAALPASSHAKDIISQGSLLAAGCGASAHGCGAASSTGSTNTVSPYTRQANTANSDRSTSTKSGTGENYNDYSVDRSNGMYGSGKGYNTTNSYGSGQSTDNSMINSDKKSSSYGSDSLTHSPNTPGSKNYDFTADAYDDTDRSNNSSVGNNQKNYDNMGKGYNNGSSSVYGKGSKNSSNTGSQGSKNYDFTADAYDDTDRSNNSSVGNNQKNYDNMGKGYNNGSSSVYGKGSNSYDNSAGGYSNSNPSGKTDRSSSKTSDWNR